MEQQFDHFRLEVEKLLCASPQSEGYNLNPLKEVKEIFERLANVFEHDKVSSVLIDLVESTKEKQKKTPIFMASYLWMYEGFYTFCVDFFCHLLIKKGHDLYDEFKRRYVFSFKEVQGVYTGTKLKFLKCHKLWIFERPQDRKLRNNIAHHNFVLDSSGILKVDGKTVDIVERYKDLLDFVIAVLQVYQDCKKAVPL